MRPILRVTPHYITQIDDIVRGSVEILQRRKGVEAHGVQAVALFHRNFGEIVEITIGDGATKGFELRRDDDVGAMAQKCGCLDAALHSVGRGSGFPLIGNDHDSNAKVLPVRRWEELKRH